MKLKRVEPDSCENCVHGTINEDEPYCLYFNRVIVRGWKGTNISLRALKTIICEDEYEDDGSRFIK